MDIILNNFLINLNIFFLDLRFIFYNGYNTIQLLSLSSTCFYMIK